MYKVAYELFCGQVLRLMRCCGASTGSSRSLSCLESHTGEFVAKNADRSPQGMRKCSGAGRHLKR
jgi:hypothetical protein